jgi:hypothetical protein
VLLNVGIRTDAVEEDDQAVEGAAFFEIGGKGKGVVC